MMTREEFLKIVNKIDTYSDYPWKHELNYLRDHDAAQRAELYSWRETAKDVGAIDPHALALHLDEQRKTIRRLREVLRSTYDIANEYVTPLAEKICKHVKATLAETEPRDERETNP